MNIFIKLLADAYERRVLDVSIFSVVFVNRTINLRDISQVIKRSAINTRSRYKKSRFFLVFNISTENTNDLNKITRKQCRKSLNQNLERTIKENIYLKKQKNKHKTCRRRLKRYYEKIRNERRICKKENCIITQSSRTRRARKRYRKCFSFVVFSR